MSCIASACPGPGNRGTCCAGSACRHADQCRPAPDRALGALLRAALDLRPAQRWQAEAVLPPGLEDLPAAWADLLPPDLPLARRNAAAAVRSVVLRLRLRAPGTPAGTPASSWAGSLRHATHLAAIFLRCRT